LDSPGPQRWFSMRERIAFEGGVGGWGSCQLYGHWGTMLLDINLYSNGSQTGL